MLPDIHMTVAIAQAHRDDLLREAERYSLISVARSTAPRTRRFLPWRRSEGSITPSLALSRTLDHEPVV